MSPFLWVAILGTVFGLAFLGNGLRLAYGPEGHAANAGRLHVAMAGIFIPVLWVIVLFSFL
ncbi:MAG: hypothetical protein WA985_00310 [Erythrobacter sp.]